MCLCKELHTGLLTSSAVLHVAASLNHNAALYGLTVLIAFLQTVMKSLLELLWWLVKLTDFNTTFYLKHNWEVTRGHWLTLQLTQNHPASKHRCQLLRNLWKYLLPEFSLILSPLSLSCVTAFALYYWNVWLWLVQQMKRLNANVWFPRGSRSLYGLQVFAGEEEGF